MCSRVVLQKIDQCQKHSIFKLAEVENIFFKNQLIHVYFLYIFSNCNTCSNKHINIFTNVIFHWKKSFPSRNHRPIGRLRLELQRHAMIIRIPSCQTVYIGTLLVDWNVATAHLNTIILSLIPNQRKVLHRCRMLQAISFKTPKQSAVSTWA